MDISKLDRTRMALAIIGLVALVDMFLEWGHVSVNGESFTGISGATHNAWGMGIGAWFPMLLLLAAGVLAALPAFGVEISLPGGLALLSALAGALSILVILLRWVTYPSQSSLGFTASWDASYGLYIGLVLAVAATAFGWLGYTAEGGNFKTIGESFKSKQITQPPTEG